MRLGAWALEDSKDSSGASVDMAKTASFTA